MATPVRLKIYKEMIILPYCLVTSLQSPLLAFFFFSFSFFFLMLRGEWVLSTPSQEITQISGPVLPFFSHFALFPAFPSNYAKYSLSLSLSLSLLSPPLPSLFAPPPPSPSFCIFFSLLHLGKLAHSSHEEFNSYFILLKQGGDVTLHRFPIVVFCPNFNRICSHKKFHS